METYIQMVVTIVCSVIASSGFWVWMLKRSEQKDVKTEMLMGLGHDRIVYLGTVYIERGYITFDEYVVIYMNNIHLMNMKISMNICISLMKKWAAMVRQNVL